MVNDAYCPSFKDLFHKKKKIYVQSSPGKLLGMSVLELPSYLQSCCNVGLRLKGLRSHASYKLPTIKHIMQDKLSKY